MARTSADTQGQAGPAPRLLQNGAAIRAIRARNNQTLESLGAAVGRSRGWVSRVERGLTAASADELAKIAAELRVPPSAITHGPDGILQNGEAIRELRERHGLTQGELAAAAGRTQSWLSYVENDKKAAALRALTDLAKGLGVPLSAITRELVA